MLHYYVYSSEYISFSSINPIEVIYSKVFKPYFYRIPVSPGKFGILTNGYYKHCLIIMYSVGIFVPLASIVVVSLGFGVSRI